jgi:hypothetical protein
VANHTVQFAKFLAQNENLPTVAAARGQLTGSAVSAAWNQRVLATLDSVMCGDTTLLVLLPISWSLASGISAFALLLSAVGLAACALASAIVFHFRQRVVFKSASFLFLLQSLLGLALLFGAIIALAAPGAVTDARCQTMLWLANLGFTLAFGPLFVKTYRIYRTQRDATRPAAPHAPARTDFSWLFCAVCDVTLCAGIFGQRRLDVIKLPDSKLALLVALLVAFDLLILSLWTGMAPLSAAVQSVISGNSVTDYLQCTASAAGGNFAIIVVTTKAALLVFGALMAFGTRRVTTTFNESKQIAWAIYNTYAQRRHAALRCAPRAPVLTVCTLFCLRVCLIFQSVRNRHCESNHFRHRRRGRHARSARSVSRALDCVFLLCHSVRAEIACGFRRKFRRIQRGRQRARGDGRIHLSQRKIAAGIRAGEIRRCAAEAAPSCQRAPQRAARLRHRRSPRDCFRTYAARRQQALADCSRSSGGGSRAKRDDRAQPRQKRQQRERNRRRECHKASPIRQQRHGGQRRRQQPDEPRHLKRRGGRVAGATKFSV